MSRRILVLLSAAILLALTFSAPAFASHEGSDHQGSPEPFAHSFSFCGSGEEYAEGHIVPLAQEQAIMAPEADGVHNPGLAHEGFAVCDPSSG